MVSLDNQDEHWMTQALELADHARAMGEVPVGAIVVKRGEVVGQGWNQPIQKCDSTAHAEVCAIRSANKTLGSYRLPGSVLYVTLEPCVMCAGAMIHARIERVVFGAYDPKTGAAGSVFDIVGTEQLNHEIEYTGGVMADACSELLREFFKQKRS